MGWGGVRRGWAGRGRRCAVAAAAAGAAGAQSAASRGALCGGGRRALLVLLLLLGGGAREQWAPSPQPSEGPWREGRGRGRRGARGAP